MRQTSSRRMNVAESSDGYHLDQQYIGILQLMIQYEFETGNFPNAESIALYEYLRQHELLAVVSWHQLKIKIWLLRKLYFTNVREEGGEPFFTNPSLKYRFELSKKIWGDRSFQEVIHQDYHEDCVFIHPHSKKPVTFSTKKRRRLFDHRRRHQDNQDYFADHNQEGVGENDVEVDPRDKEFQDIAILKSILCFSHNNGGVIPPPGSVELHNFVCQSIIKSDEMSRPDLAGRICEMEVYFRNVTAHTGTYDINFPNALQQEKYDLSRQIWGNRGCQADVGTAEEQEDVGENTVDVDEEAEQEEDTDDKMMLKPTKSSETPSDLRSFQ